MEDIHLVVILPSRGTNSVYVNWKGDLFDFGSGSRVKAVPSEAFGGRSAVSE